MSIHLTHASGIRSPGQGASFQPANGLDAPFRLFESLKAWVRKNKKPALEDRQRRGR